MAQKLVLKNRKVYIGGYDVSGYSNQVTLDGQIEEVDSTNFGSSAKEAVAGLEMVKGTVGLMLPNDFALEKALFDARGTGLVASFLIEGSSAGNVAVSAYGLSGKHAPGAKIGALLGSTVELSGLGQALVRGKLLEAPTSRSASANTAGIQFAGGVSATQSLYIAYHVIEMTATSIAAVLQRDDNSGFTSPVTAISLSTFTAVGGELKSVAGAITDDWYRLSFTLTGAGSYTAVAVIAVQ